MADFTAFNATSHPIIRCENDWNELLDHGLEKVATYIFRTNGSYYEVIKGGTSSVAGNIAFGGEGNAGGVDGTDADATIQGAIDALETAAQGGVIFIKNPGFTYDTSLTIHKSGIFLVGETRPRTTTGCLLTYSGAAQGIILGQSTELVWNSGLKNIRLLDSGTGTDGIQCYGNMCLFDDIQVTGFDSGLVLEGQQVGADYSGDNRVTNSSFDTNANYGIENYAGDTFMSNCNIGNNTAVGLLVKSPAAYHSGGFQGVNLNCWGGTIPLFLDSVLNCSFNSLEISTASSYGLEIKSSTHETMRINIHGGRIWNNTGATAHINLNQTAAQALNRVLIHGVAFDTTAQVLDYTITNATSLHSVLLDACQFDSTIDMGFDLGVAAGNFSPGEIAVRNGLGFRTIGAAQGYITEIRSTGTIADTATTAVITHGLGDVANGYTPIAAEIMIIPITAPTATFYKGTDSIASGTTSKAVAHGCPFTPSLGEIQIVGGEDPTNPVGTVWVDTIGAANFTVNCENDPGASNWDFGWVITRPRFNCGNVYTNTYTSTQFTVNSPTPAEGAWTFAWEAKMSR